MPISYRIDEQAGIVYFTPAVITTELEWRESRAQLRADPRYLPGMSLLVDARDHETLPSPELLTKVATGPLCRSRPDHVPCWAIVVSRPASYGMGRMLALLAEPNGLDVRVFRDIGDAEAWLRDGRVSEGTDPVVAYPPLQRPER